MDSTEENIQAVKTVLNLKLTVKEEEQLRTETLIERDVVNVTGEQFTIFQTFAEREQPIPFLKTNGSVVVLRVSDVTIITQSPNSFRINYVLLHPMP